MDASFVILDLSVTPRDTFSLPFTVYAIPDIVRRGCHEMHLGRERVERRGSLHGKAGTYTTTHRPHISCVPYHSKLSSSVPQDWELLEKRREYSVLMLAYITAMHDNQEFAVPSVSELQKVSDEDLYTLERRIKDASVNSEIQKRNECTVCMDGQSCVVLVPCGHQGFCVACANDIHVCPLCRAPVTRHIKIANTGF